MDTFDTYLQSKDSISVNDEIKDFLLESAKWAKFLSILGFVCLGIALIISIILIIAAIFFSSQLSNSQFPVWVIIIYPVIIVLYYFPINYLYQFSKSIKQGIISNNQELFTSGFSYLKSHYKFLGISTIAVIGLYIIIFIISMLLIVYNYM